MTALEQFQEKIIDGSTSVLVPGIILGVFFLLVIAFQIVAILKNFNGLTFIIPIFFGIAGGFSSLVTMSYYSTFRTAIDEEWVNYLTEAELALAPNFDAYTILFLVLAILYFVSTFVSFVMAIVQLIRSRNAY